jgi:hypothetical protein
LAFTFEGDAELLLCEIADVLHGSEVFLGQAFAFESGDWGSLEGVL